MRPWSAEHADRITRPLRHNGIPYKGINVGMLWSASVTKGYACRLWLTFRQAQELGGCVRNAARQQSWPVGQGYRRFRCRTCSKPFNERSGGIACCGRFHVTAKR